MEKKSELIFIPLPEHGHVLSTIEFGKRLVGLNCGIHRITILSWKLPYAPHASAYAKSIAASFSCIRVIELPEIENPPSMELADISPEAYIYDFVKKNIPFVNKTIRNILSSSMDSVRVAGLVLDFFCVPMIDVGNELSIPCYIFLTSNASFLGMMQYLPKRHSMIATSGFSNNSDGNEESLPIPAFVNPVPAKVLPPGLFDKDSYDAYIKLSEWFVDAKGILVNTFTQLEPYALKHFANGQNYPPVYPVGPVLYLKDRPNPNLDPVQHEEIMRWLDDQPESSVVFLCFGSMGVFRPSQVKEIARGLELVGYRFLWAIRTDPLKNKGFNDLLPEGFLARVGGRGMVCGWAPQIEVLAHKAVGGFVSHCGWNSILESLWHGVPIVTWPMYAEQQLNAFTMVKELGLAVEMRLDYVEGESELVMADEIARAVKCLMEGDSTVRKKVKEISEVARKAVTEAGSSFVSLKNFAQDVLGNHKL